MKIGRRTYDLYDVSGREQVERDKRFLEGLGYATHIEQRGDRGYWSIYCYPKFKKGRSGQYASAPKVKPRKSKASVSRTRKGR